jgi:hypothetical protein
MEFDFSPEFAKKHRLPVSVPVDFVFDHGSVFTAVIQ